ncbi:hypothetical protein MRX96_047667 [Rhipicephalus microplus]
MDTSNTCKRPGEDAEGEKAATTKEVEQPPAKAMNVRRRPAPNILSERRIAENLPPTPGATDTTAAAATSAESADIASATDRSSTEGAFSGAPCRSKPP